MEYKRRVEPTAVERGLLDGLLSGLKITEAAEAMGISSDNARDHLARLRDNRGLNTLFQLVAWYGCKKAGHLQNPLE